jgi:hypothetical protein
MRSKKKKNKRVGEKISLLRHEGEPQDKAVATALSMERSGRLRSGGRYIHKRKTHDGKRSRKRNRR